MASHFGDRIFEAVKGKQTGLVVGIDPVYNRLPMALTKRREMNAEFSVSEVSAIFEFSRRVIRIVGPIVPAVKLNIGFFERYLWEGVKAYYLLVSEAKKLGLEVIGDVKRGDIGHTAKSYAAAHLEDALAPDAITINGFAGSDGIVPFADSANEQGKGIFVWVRASNPSAGVIQDFADADGVKMYEKLADVVGEIANEPGRIGESGYSNVGMVIGGTTAEQTKTLREKFDKVWFLVPGLGSQGASAADCVKFCKPDGSGALINASRSIIYAYERDNYKDKFGDNWKKCIAQAAIDAKAELAKALQ